MQRKLPFGKVMLGQATPKPFEDEVVALPHPTLSELDSCLQNTGIVQEAPPGDSHLHKSDGKEPSLCVDACVASWPHSLPHNSRAIQNRGLESLLKQQDKSMERRSVLLVVPERPFCCGMEIGPYN